MQVFIRIEKGMLQEVWSDSRAEVFVLDTDEAKMDDESRIQYDRDLQDIQKSVRCGILQKVY